MLLTFLQVWELNIVGLISQTLSYTGLFDQNVFLSQTMRGVPASKVGPFEEHKNIVLFERARSCCRNASQWAPKVVASAASTTIAD